MKAITVRQPWASAIAVGAKLVENRQAGFPDRYRGLIAIHAGAGWSDRGETDARITGLFPHLTVARDGLEEWRIQKPTPKRPVGMLPQGAIIATAELVDVHDASGCCAPWGEDRYTINTGHEVTRVRHLVLENVAALREPVDCAGALGLWTVPPDVEREVLAAA